MKKDGTFVDIVSAAGVHQGCPLGSAAFSARLHISLAQIMKANRAYIDNVTLTVAGKLRVAYEAIDALAGTSRMTSNSGLTPTRMLGFPMTIDISC